MSVTPSKDTFSVNTSGINDALDTIQKSKEQILGLYEEQLDKEEEQGERYDKTKEKIVNAFAEIPDNEEPISDDNFNVIINSLITDNNTSDILTSDVTNHLRSIILATLGQDPDINLSELSEVDAEQFTDILTQIIVDHADENGNLSVETFEDFITEYGFDTQESQIEEDVTENDDESNDKKT